MSADQLGQFKHGDLVLAEQGAQLGVGVFIGPGVILTNDRFNWRVIFVTMGEGQRGAGEVGPVQPGRGP